MDIVLRYFRSIYLPDIETMIVKTNKSIETFIFGFIIVAIPFLFYVYVYLYSSFSYDDSYDTDKYAKLDITSYRMTFKAFLGFLLYFTSSFLLIYAVKYLYLYFIFTKVVKVILNIFVFLLLALAIGSLFKSFHYIRLFVALPIFLLVLYAYSFNFGINISKTEYTSPPDTHDASVITSSTSGVLPKSLAKKVVLIPTSDKKLSKTGYCKVYYYKVTPKNSLSKLLGFNGTYLYFEEFLYYVK